MKKYTIEKGEGTITIELVSDGIKMSYSCIDDYSSKILTTDGIMKILGYQI